MRRPKATAVQKRQSMTLLGKLPLVIVTGFLGSGKTTLLRRILARQEMENSFVLVNEIVDADFDQRLLPPGKSSVCCVKHGCICCTARQEFKSILLDLVETNTGGNDVRRIVLETSGMTNPAPLIETIVGNSVLNNRIAVTGVMTLVDCVNAESSSKDYPEFGMQVASADHIVLTKTDLVADRTTRIVAALIRNLNPFAEIVADENGLAAVLQGHTPSVERLPALSDHDRDAPLLSHSDIRAFCISVENTCRWTDFAIWLSLLLHAYGRKILRIKGVLDLGNSSRVAINCVQELVYFPEHLDGGHNADACSTVAFIVRGLEPERILQSLKQFFPNNRLHLQAGIKDAAR